MDLEIYRMPSLKGPWIKHRCGRRSMERQKIFQIANFQRLMILEIWMGLILLVSLEIKDIAVLVIRSHLHK